MKINRFVSAGLSVLVMVAASLVVPLAAQAALVTPPSAAFEVGSTSSGLCAQAQGYVSGSAVDLDACNGQINQKWYINRAGYYNGQIAYDIEIAKAGSFQCLNDLGGSTAGAVVNTVACNYAIQGTRFVENGNQLYNIGAGECLDSTVSGASLVLNPCTSTVSQQWFQVPNKAKP